MNIVFNVRERLNLVFVALLGTVLLAACGALFAFVLSPGQALQARRIERMPDMTVEDVAALDHGDDVLITGRLEDNPIIAEDRFVAYVRQTWQVTVPTPSNQSDSQSSKPTGQWETVERIVPDLTLNVNGSQIEILRVSDVTLSGPLHEQLISAYTFRKAEYNNELLAEGSERVRGFQNGDLATVLGAKASTGGILPDELFAGDRVAFVEHKKSSARSLFICGLCMMGTAPIVLGGGIASALFGRRRR